MITTSAPAKSGAIVQPAPPSAAPPPEGIYPLNTRGQGGAHHPYWAPNPPQPPALSPSVSHTLDPTSMVRSVTGAVVAVSAAMRNLNAALEGEVQDPAAVDRAMAALNAAVADQALTARRVLYRFEDYDPL